jgi:hypothetical protein
VQEVTSVLAGKGVMPKSGDSIIAPKWIASENDLANDPFSRHNSAFKPTPANPTIKTLRSSVSKPKKEERDWDIVTPPGSPTHFDEFCSLADIVARSEGKEKYPLLPPSTPGFQVIPFRYCIELNWISGHSALK